MAFHISGTIYRIFGSGVESLATNAHFTLLWNRSFLQLLLSTSNLVNVHAILLHLGIWILECFSFALVTPCVLSGLWDVLKPTYPTPTVVRPAVCGKFSNTWQHDYICLLFWVVSTHRHLKRNFEPGSLACCFWGEAFVIHSTILTATFQSYKKSPSSL